jgi:hypothetical protein
VQGSPTEVIKYKGFNYTEYDWEYSDFPIVEGVSSKVKYIVTKGQLKKKATSSSQYSEYSITEKLEAKMTMGCPAGSTSLSGKCWVFVSPNW